MQTIELTESFYKSLQQNLLIYDWNYVYKYSPYSKEIMEYLIQNINMLPKEYLTEPKAFLEYKDYVGVLIQHHRNLVPVSELLILNKKFNKKALVKKVVEIVLELEEKGINYFDVHSKNIMTDGKKIKLIDMDEAVILRSDYDKVLTRAQLLYFILETFINLPSLNGLLDYFVEIDDLKKIYSSEVMDYAKSSKELSSDIKDVDLFPIIEEFDDLKKGKEARKIILNYIKKM